MNVNEQKAWDRLLAATKNPIGTAAIMGNIKAESNFNPECATGKNKTPNYVLRSDTGENDFVNDGIAFGLAQWCYYTRKKLMLDRSKDFGVSLGSFTFQIDYLIWEMSQKYKSVWKAVTEATNIRTVSDVVMLKYEKPSNTTETMKKRRADYSQQYYDEMIKKQVAEKIEKAKKVKKVVAVKNVNIRAGNSKSYPIMGQLKAGNFLEWVATSDDNWHAVKYGKDVCWISGEFSKVEESTT